MCYRQCQITQLLASALRASIPRLPPGNIGPVKKRFPEIKNLTGGIAMPRFVAFATVLFSALWAAAAVTTTVDCDAGQSLNRTLAKMDKFTPATVTVKGTCTEYMF